MQTVHDPLEPPDQDDYFHVLIRPLLLADEGSTEDDLRAGIGDAWCKSVVSEAVAGMQPGDVIEIVVRRGYV